MPFQLKKKKNPILYLSSLAVVSPPLAPHGVPLMSSP
jgi:hypothetical protein